MNESAKGGAATTNMMTGYHVGAVLTALLGIIIIEPLGWHWMFVVGALPALVLVPVMWRYLPESAAFLRVRAGLADRSATSTAPARANPISTLFHHGLGRSTIAFWVTSFMGLLLVYGLNTWLPQIMKSAGYQLGAALALLLVLNVGGVVGLLVAGRVSDRIGNRRATIAWFTAAALFLALLSIRLPGVGDLRQRVPGRRVRVQLAGARVRLRRPRLPGLGARHRDGHGERCRPRRRDLRPADRGLAAHRWAWPTRGASTSSPSWRPSAPCPSRW